MSIELLDKTRKISKLLHNNTSSKVVFNDICRVLTECLSSNILVISTKGKILGLSFEPEVPVINDFAGAELGSRIDPVLNDRLLEVLSTKENVSLSLLGLECSGNTCSMINPIEIAGERLGTIFTYRPSPVYGIDDIIVSEFGTAVVGLEIMRSQSEENEEEIRRIQVVRSAVSTLSYSELEASVHIFNELEGSEGVLVASKIADRAGITRSVIVNALRKFESAGVIETRSSGMKGTYIKVLNPYLFEEIRNVKGIDPSHLS